jgi:Periplasmic binding proteins and sugar binding domain of LacI family
VRHSPARSHRFPCCQRELPIPVVTVSGHNTVNKVTNILLDHGRAAELALEHLFKLGHRRIAFIKGQEFSSDTQARWDAIVQAAARLGLTIYPKLTTQLEGEVPSPDLGYQVTRRLLARHEPFSAIFAFNDISAMARFAPCARRDCEYRKMSPWSVSTTSRAPPTRIPDSPPCGNPCARWGRLPPRPFCGVSRVTARSIPRRSPSSPSW